VYINTLIVYPNEEDTEVSEAEDDPDVPVDAPSEAPMPLVMTHGYGSGLAMYYRNLDSLAVGRKVYCMDWLGLGRSSRPDFPTRYQP
jgi:pimeloyl-ACP methyl ester carboxylesterase